MKKEEFIDKWLVGYEDLEQKAEFSKEMMQDLESLTEPTQPKGLDLKALEKRLDEALAKETLESLNEWLKKFREKNPLPTQEGEMPKGYENWTMEDVKNWLRKKRIESISIDLTQEGVVSAEEVEKIARKEILDSYRNPTSNVHGQYIGFQKGYIQAMHTYASQTREEIKGKFSIEQQPDGTYKLYVDRDGLHHGLWICSLSEFDKNKESTIRTILSCLNQTREEELKNCNHPYQFLSFGEDGYCECDRCGTRLN